MKRLAILISGTGSNMKAIHKACMNGTIDANVCVVISNNPKAPGLEYAKSHNIQHFTVDHTKFSSRKLFEYQLESVLGWFNIDYVCLAGFMRILGDDLVNRYAGKMVNIHPSLLPKYTGLNTHQRALDAGDSQYGSTVHWVIPELDAGPIIDQEVIEIQPGDDVDLMKQRLSFREPGLYVRAMRGLCREPLV